jgi:hypothetical protein
LARQADHVSTDDYDHFIDPEERLRVAMARQSPAWSGSHSLVAGPACRRIRSAQHTNRAGNGGHTTSMPIEDALETPTRIAIAHRDRSYPSKRRPC